VILRRAQDGGGGWGKKGEAEGFAWGEEGGCREWRICPEGGGLCSYFPVVWEGNGLSLRGKTAFVGFWHG
jgi:hypothetical protein